MNQKTTTTPPQDRRIAARAGGPGTSPTKNEAGATAPGLVAIVGDYFRQLGEQFGQAWNRFWFAPSDPFVLSLMRVLAGLIAIYTVLTYTPDLEWLLGSEGLLARESVTQLRGDFYTLSYFYWLDMPAKLWAAHLAGLAVLTMFTVGLFTRVTSILSLVVLLSYFHRSFVVTTEFEPVLAFVVFYLCLAPCGAYLSIDRWLAKRKAADGQGTLDAPPMTWTATVPTRLLQVHLALVYGMMLLAQLNEMPWWDGTAFWWIIGRRESAMTDLVWLNAHPWLINAWTHSFVLFEALFLAMAWNRLAAPLLVAASVAVWGLFAVATGLAPFAAIMVVAGLSFLAPSSLRAFAGCCGLAPLLK